MLQNQFTSQKLVQLSEPQFEPSIHQTPKEKDKITPSPYLKWTKEEDVLYVRFLKANVQRMKKTQFRKPYNKFKKMSQYVTSKDSFQCRSHHQKMMKRFGSIQLIIENLWLSLQKYYNRVETIAKSGTKRKNETKTIKKTKSQEKLKQIDNNNVISQIKIENLTFEIKSPNERQNCLSGSELSPIHKVQQDLPQWRHSFEKQQSQKLQINQPKKQIQQSPSKQIFMSPQSQQHVKSIFEVRGVKNEQFELQMFSNGEKMQFTSSEYPNRNQNSPYQNEAYWYWQDYYCRQQYMHWPLLNYPPLGVDFGNSNPIYKKNVPPTNQILKRQDDTGL